jgi:hypothetical protein
MAFIHNASPSTIHFILPFFASFEVTINKFHTKHCNENMDLQRNFCIIMQMQKDYKSGVKVSKD